MDRFLLSPGGDADGMLLTDSTEIHFSPYLSSEIVSALRPGIEVTVRGVRPRGTDMYSAVLLRTTDGRQIVDHGPPMRRRTVSRSRRGSPVEVEGIIRHALHGPKGETSGALLEDGRIIRVPSHADGLPPDMLAPGDRLAARGDCLTNNLGTVVTAREFAVSPAPLPMLDEGTKDTGSR